MRQTRIPCGHYYLPIWVGVRGHLASSLPSLSQEPGNLGRGHPPGLAPLKGRSLCFSADGHLLEPDAEYVHWLL